MKGGGSVFLKDNILTIARYIINKFKDSKLVVVSSIGRSPYPYSTDELLKNFNNILERLGNDNYIKRK